MKENYLQQQCIDYLSKLALTNNIYFFAPLNETAMTILRIFKVENDKAAKIIMFLKKMGLIPGTPDLIVFYNGTSIFIELKRPGKKASKNQLRIHEKINASGHKVVIIDNFLDFQQTLKYCGIENE